jgi:GTP-binding protein HflX
LLPEQRLALEHQAARNHDVVAVSAVTGEGCDALLALFDKRVESDRLPVRLDVAISDGATLAWLYQHGEVLSREDDEREAHIDVRLSEADLGRFKSRRLTH